MEQYKTIKLKINCNKTDLNKLFQCNRESALIWNECLKFNQLNYKDNKKLHTTRELVDYTKTIDVQTICANSKQIIGKKIFDAYNAISKARKVGRTDLNYPWKEKNFYPTEWSYQYLFPNYEKNEIRLTTSQYIGEDGKNHNGQQIRMKFKMKIPNNIKLLKLIYKNGFYAVISYLVEVEEREIISNNIASIDLGEIHAITSIDNNNNQLIITGRKIRSLKQFRNKKIAELTSKIDKCKNGSNQRKKYKKALNYLKAKTERQVMDCIHKLTRMYTNWAVEKGISAVYVGDVTNIELHVKSSKIVNQKLNQWDYGKILHYLEYKLGLEGIKLIKVNEAYSSQICPTCGEKTKPKGRVYKCSNCESEYHRDIVGAWNILNFNTDYNLKLPEANIKYLRIA